MAESPPEIDLEERIWRIIDRVGAFPHYEFWERNQYFQKLWQDAGGEEGIREIFARRGAERYFSVTTVPIPSLRQRVVAAAIEYDGSRHARKKLEMSIPGSRKTGGVLAAIDLINKKLAPEGKRVKTLYASPGGLVSTMMAEAARFLPEYRTVCITQQHRERDILRAAQAETDIIFLGYEMSYRKAQMEGHHSPRRLFELMETIPSLEEAGRILSGLVGNDRTTKFLRKKPSWVETLKYIEREKQKRESLSVVQELRQRVFTFDQPYYVILGEAHNLVDVDSETAKAFVEVFKSARWGALETGTAVRNNIHQMSYLMYLLGAVENPRDWSRIVRNDPKRARAMLKPHVLEPVVTRVQQVDSEVPELEERVVEYDPSPAEVRAHLELLNCGLFSGTERLYLDRILIAHPQALLPERFDTEVEKPMYFKVQQFFEERPGLADELRTTQSGLIRAEKGVIEDAIRDGNKVLLFCEYDIAPLLEKEFRKYGCRRIDQSVSAEITSEGISDRQVALMEATTNPDVHMLIATRGTLKEGLDAREFTVILNHDEPSLEFKRSQSIARSYRSGQHEPVQVVDFRGRGIETQYSIAAFRRWKAHLANRVYEGPDPTPTEVEEFIREEGITKFPELRSLLELSSRGKVALIFNALVGMGSEAFVRNMASRQNALLLSRHFNYQWEYTYSANCARLLCETVIPEIEKEVGILQDVLDGGSGPATIARTLRRATTNVDLLRLQLEYGVTACEQEEMKEARCSRYYLGSIHDLDHLVSVSSTEDEVFEPGKKYVQEEGILDQSLDIYVCSLAFYYLNQEERKAFFTEARRVLRDEKYLVMLMPRTKIASECEVEFLRDVERSGFTVDTSLTGEYSARRGQNIDTGESIATSSFNPYVIVARRSREMPSSEDRQFMLQQDYRLVEGSARKQDLDHAVEEGKKPRVVYGDFYRRTGVRTIGGEGIGVASPIEDSPDAGDLVRKYDPDAIQDALQRLATALEDSHG